MSLTTFVATPDVRDRIRLVHPVTPPKISAPIKCEPKSKRYALVGTAFDYLVRFEMQRRVENTSVRTWVAEGALNKIRQLDDKGHLKGFISLAAMADGSIQVDNNVKIENSGRLSGEEFTLLTIQQMGKVITDAKAATSNYKNIATPTVEENATIAGHAIRLAKLDGFYRSGRMDATFMIAANEDIQDLTELLALFPFEVFTQKKNIWLNPSFGDTAFLFGGADADLIADGLLVDIKVTKSELLKLDYLDQLLGYLLLARHEGQTNPSFPPINQLGVYFARHGYLWTIDAAEWEKNPQFEALESWFFSQAQE
jgi:hypothetical protein